jgi:hypothetical protein
MNTTHQGGTEFGAVESPVLPNEKTQHTGFEVPRTQKSFTLLRTVPRFRIPPCLGTSNPSLKILPFCTGDLCSKETSQQLNRIQPTIRPP